jgi:LysR family transcriptional regulator for bpeEF and oprC
MDVVQAMSLFRRVAESGSFSVAAKESRLSQPTVSKRVSALEKRLGVKLISRSTRQLVLTDAGKQYYERCIHILDELAETETGLRRQLSSPAGLLRVNIPIVFGRLEILPRLWSFLARYPELRMELIMDDRAIDLVKEGVDMAIRVGRLDGDAMFVAQKIGDSPRTTVASRDYLARRGEPLTLQDLTRHDCIVYSLLRTRDEWHFTGPRGNETIRVKGRFTTNSPDAIREAAIAGTGIAVTPIWLVRDAIRRGALVPILGTYTPTPFEINAIYPERRFVPVAVRCFIEHLRQELNTCLPSATPDQAQEV